MMNPKAMEALKKARELFAEKADDIPEQITQPLDAQNNPLRKPRVVLLPPNAPKFDEHSMKKEHKMESKAEGITRVMHENGMTPPKQIDKYVEMSVSEATKACIAKGIKKPADIAKETGKNVNQIYTAMWKIKMDKRKAKLAAKTAVKIQSVKQQLKDEWDREPTPFEDAHYVVLKSREQYEAEIDSLNTRIGELLLKNQELRTIVKYLESKNV